MAFLVGNDVFGKCPIMEYKRKAKRIEGQVELRKSSGKK
jgi:hypothetical protein